MASRPLTAKDSYNISPATGPSPADFPLGSPESRAIVRSRLDRMQKHAQRDRALDAAVQALEDKRVYEPKYIRERNGIDDPAADFIDEHFLAVRKGEKPLTTLPECTASRKWESPVGSPT